MLAASCFYLWTAEARHDQYPEGYLVYLAGETKKALNRFRSHTRNLRHGVWTILDIEAMRGVASAARFGTVQSERALRRDSSMSRRSKQEAAR